MHPGSLEDLKEKSVRWGFPILMPPNRIDKGKFTFNGQDYVFDINEAGIYHIHGLVHNLPWKWPEPPILVVLGDYRHPFRRHLA